MGFSIVNHPAVEVPPLWETPYFTHQQIHQAGAREGSLPGSCTAASGSGGLHVRRCKQRGGWVKAFGGFPKSTGLDWLVHFARSYCGFDGSPTYPVILLWIFDGNPTSPRVQVPAMEQQVMSREAVPLAEVVARQLSAYAPWKCVETQQYLSISLL